MVSCFIALGILLQILLSSRMPMSISFLRVVETSTQDEERPVLFGDLQDPVVSRVIISLGSTDSDAPSDSINSVEPSAAQRPCPSRRLNRRRHRAEDVGSNAASAFESLVLSI
eukprot:m.129008 g.129008  ORF g.129008 m.129008 type:complete len:113 (-) comp52303_c0_seq5:14-352(-)